MIIFPDLGMVFSIVTISWGTCPAQTFLGEWQGFVDFGHRIGIPFLMDGLNIFTIESFWYFPHFQNLNLTSIQTQVNLDFS